MYIVYAHWHYVDIIASYLFAHYNLPVCYRLFFTMLLKGDQKRYKQLTLHLCMYQLATGYVIQVDAKHDYVHMLKILAHLCEQGGDPTCTSAQGKTVKEIAENRLAVALLGMFYMCIKLPDI